MAVAVGSDSCVDRTLLCEHCPEGTLDLLI
jgi:hypothetical protein